MADFEVKFSMAHDGLVEYTAQNRMPYKAPIVLDDLTRLLLKRFDHWVGVKDTHYEREDLEILGRVLYQLLLPQRSPRGSDKSLRMLFEADYTQFLRQPASPADRFRLTLEIHEKASTLAQYPWEFLFIPPLEDGQIDAGFFFSGERNQLILTRYVPNQLQQVRPKTNEPLRILVVFAHPKELPNLSSEKTLKVIKTIRQMHGVEVRLADNPTHTQLRKLMNGPEDPEDAGRDVQDRVRFKPDIVHFIAHGEPDRLALIRPAEDIQKDKDDDKPLREAAWCDAQEILDLFANHTPHLVFLQACDTAREVEEKKFSSLARELVYKKIPSVIAMQYSIEVEDAGLFACTFYEEIRQGSHIDEAVRVGREVFGQKQDDRKVFADRRFATPVVYFRQKGAQPLFDRLKQRQSANRPLPNESAKEVPSAGTAVQHRTCPRCDSKAGNVCCTRCLLGFVCDCGNEYVDPLGTYCGNCPRKIEQPPWPTPATAPPTKFDPTGRRSNVPFPQDRESGETISTTAFETS